MRTLLERAAEPKAMVIPGLLSPTVEILDPDLGELRTLLAWKRVRPTSTGLYHFLQDSGVLSRRRKQVLNAVAAIYNARQQWPINDEIQAWLVAAKQIPADGNPNHVRPRTTDLSRGWYETRVVLVDGVKTTEKHFVPCNILVAGEPRSNAHGTACITWHVREFSEVV